MFDLIDTIKSVESVLDMAIWLEKKGKAFYESAVTSFQDDELKSTLLFLIEQEQKHERIYKKLAEKVSGTTDFQEELFGEYGMFIRLLVSEITRSLDISPSFTREQLIQAAIRFEKDTLLYFHEIKRLFQGNNREAIEAICNEERNHIRLLMDME
jgi:rubrerythrin